MEKIIRHSGTIIAITPGQVTVRMQVLSACASCESHAHCGFAEKKDKEVTVATSRWRDYAVGDSVQVVIEGRNGLRAVAIAYVLPACLLLAFFALFCCLHLPEALVALLTLATVALYVLLLYLFRHRLQQRFTFRLG